MLKCTANSFTLGFKLFLENCHCRIPTGFSMSLQHDMKKSHPVGKTRCNWDKLYSFFLFDTVFICIAFLYTIFPLIPQGLQTCSRRLIFRY